MFVWLCIDLFQQIHLLMSIKLRIAKISASFQQELKFRKILKKGLSIGKHKFKMKKKKLIIKAAVEYRLRCLESYFCQLYMIARPEVDNYKQ